MLKINYFASVREQTGIGSENLELPPGIRTTGELADYLAARGDNWEVLRSPSDLLVAVNQAICSRDQQLGADDEVAFFPPMTGG